MAAVAGAGGGDQMLLLRMRPRRQRLPLADLTNLSSATSVITRLKAKPKRTSPGSSTSSIGSSTVPRIPTPPPATLSVSVAATKGKDKATRELQSSTTHLNKIQKISKPKVKTGSVLPGPSSPPSKNTRKITRKEQPHTEPLISPVYASSKTKKTGGDVLPPSKNTRKITRKEQPYTEPLISPVYASSKTKEKTGGDVLPPSKNTRKVTRKEQPCTEPLISPLYASSKTKVKTVDGLSGASSLPSKKTRKVTSSSSREEEQADMMELLEEMSCDEESPVPRQEDFIEERRAYFAEIDAFELVEEFVSSGSDAE